MSNPILEAKRVISNPNSKRSDYKKCFDDACNLEKLPSRKDQIEVFITLIEGLTTRNSKREKKQNKSRIKFKKVFIELIDTTKNSELDDFSFYKKITSYIEETQDDVVFINVMNELLFGINKPTKDQEQDARDDFAKDFINYDDEYEPKVSTYFWHWPSMNKIEKEIKKRYKKR